MPATATEDVGLIGTVAPGTAATASVRRFWRAPRRVAAARLDAVEGGRFNVENETR